MAGAGLHFDLQELVSMGNRLEAASRQAEDLSPLMDAIGQAMEATTHERFAGERGPDGKKWTPSIKQKAGAVGEYGPVKSGKTLTQDGHLDNSVTHRAGADSVEIGTNLVYAAIHQFGGTIKAKAGHLKFALPGGLGFRSVKEVTMPARPFLGLGGDDPLTIIELAETFLGDAFEGAAA